LAARFRPRGLRDPSLRQDAASRDLAVAGVEQAETRPVARAQEAVGAADDRAARIGLEHRGAHAQRAEQRMSGEGPVVRVARERAAQDAAHEVRAATAVAELHARRLALALLRE